MRGKEEEEVTAIANPKKGSSREDSGEGAERNLVSHTRRFSIVERHAHKDCRTFKLRKMTRKT